MSAKKGGDLMTVPHPGLKIKEELERKEIKQNEFAKEIGIANTHLNEILKGHKNISPELALLFEASLGIGAIVIMSMQMNYSLEVARLIEDNKLKLEKLSRWKEIKEFVPVNFFKKHNFLTGNPEEDERRIFSIYNVNSLLDLKSIFNKPYIARFRKSEKLISDEKNIIAWVKLIEYLSRVNKVEKFDTNKREVLITKLRKIFLGTNVIANTEKALAEAGIKLILHSKPEHSPVDGVAFWEDNNPCIGISLRFKRIDNFAYTIFHELGHVYLHMSDNINERYIDIWDESEEDKSVFEKQADEFARNCLIKPDKWERFKTNTFKFDDYSIIKFSHENEVHPAIVRGRLCFEGLISYKVPTNIDYKIK